MTDDNQYDEYDRYREYDEIYLPDRGPASGVWWFGWPLVLLVLLLVAAGAYATTQRNTWDASFSRGDSRATLQMSEIAKAIEMYKLDNRGQVPRSLAVLTEIDAETGESYLFKIPLDPWDNRFRYAPLDARTFFLISDGEDGVPDTDDDLWYPERD